MQHFFEVLLPQSGTLEDRQLLKEKLSSHKAYRQFSGDGDVTWMSRLAKSAHATYHLLEDLN